MMLSNILDSLPENLEKEVFETILSYQNIKIERIVSKGYITPDSKWYDQDENEWVMVIEGKASLMLEDGLEHILSKGSYLNIPAHTKHRVTWTDPNNLTIWLAIFYK
ncbi:cupin domain-containing protein [Candidatus Nitrosacidococcus sp. I8]|uniref:cupin domain-containing protein n=1 Tax=Candidatus Nitrosacidococcus sp. I8 TaxID=2942908 RepID=UPI0022273EE3|nr:cupin domain-containing protein [Candidatus Nitrosacidococcus sp. I8]CAH9019889.1 hypothetical protein NURINAE_01800 [Candidatus Nitrosacidococcus sp. I8]